MKKIFYTLFVSLGLLLSGCPYQSDVEISTYEESLKVDKDLIGEWVAFHEDGAREELNIEKLAKSVLGVNHKEIDNNSRFKGSNKFRAYAIELGGIPIFNIETKEGKYLFLKYGWTGKNEFYIQAVKDDFVNQNFSPEEVTKDNLKSFLTENINQEKMFEEKLEFYRKDSPEYQKVKMFMKKSGF